MSLLSMRAELTAAIVLLQQTEPNMLIMKTEWGDMLPSGLFDPLKNRTLEISLRNHIKHQTGLEQSYVEQLYTFGDQSRKMKDESTQILTHIMSVGYLALTKPIEHSPAKKLATSIIPHSFYTYFPWEDWRKGRPKIIDTHIIPAILHQIKNDKKDNKHEKAYTLEEKLKTHFALNTMPWDEERVLERYETLYAAKLLPEYAQDQNIKAPQEKLERSIIGKPMRFDHRRIMATAIARLRGKLKYRPVIFELMPDIFTLTDLQKGVEAISGRILHKQNFRRLVDKANLVEPTGKMTTGTGGRPASYFRFRRDVMLENTAPGLRLGLTTSRTPAK